MTTATSKLEEAKAVLEILKRARKAQEIGWCKGHFSTRELGNPEYTAFCMEGALLYAVSQGWDDRENAASYPGVHESAKSALRRTFKSLTGHDVSVAVGNDNYMTSKEDALTVFDTAIFNIQTYIDREAVR